MTLRGKILLKNVVVVVGVLALATAAACGLLSIRNHVLIGAQEVHELKSFDAMRLRIDIARQELSGDETKVAHARELLQQCLSDARYYPGFQPRSASTGTIDYGLWDSKVRYDVAAGIETVMQPMTRAADDGTPPPPADVQVARLDKVMDRLELAVRECHDFVRQQQDVVESKLLQTLIGLVFIGGLTLLGAGAFSLWEYRAVMGPLARLRSGVLQVARGEFSQPVDTSGDRELAEVATEFNRMAAELRGFYQKLEEKVEQKSRELVRSQRLASVGFLAAGVAHEINNPLGIMSGYAELTLKRLEEGFDPAASAEVADTMRIVRDEAFRCKQITEKLLSMTRLDGDNREKIALPVLAEDVSKLLAGLRAGRGKQVRLSFAPSEALEIVGNANEIKQVLLNLLINGLEAVSPGNGVVNVAGRRENGSVEIVVSDNGRGITPETLDRIFEPFFTCKRGAGEPGTGLGLSIANAIVESHGGTIRASSGGAGKGSEFTLRFPAAVESHNGH